MAPRLEKPSTHRLYKPKLVWDLIVSVPDHCLSFYFVEEKCQLKWGILLCYSMLKRVLQIFIVDVSPN